MEYFYSEGAGNAGIAGNGGNAGATGTLDAVGASKQHLREWEHNIPLRGAGGATIESVAQSVLHCVNGMSIHITLHFSTKWNKCFITLNKLLNNENQFK